MTPISGGLGAGATIVITQTETVLSMEQQAGGQSRTVVYRLDGSESTSSSPWLVVRWR